MAADSESTPKLLDEREAVLRSIRAGKILTPASPIRTRELFAGRMAQLRQVVESIYQPGQHALIHGERGVGKTSLANMVGPMLADAGSHVLTIKVNCDATDSFASAWKKALENLSFARKATIGFEPMAATEARSLSESLPPDAKPHDVLAVLRFLNMRMVFIFDEFDRLPRTEALVFTDLAKAISDFGAEVTIVLVGVADTVDQLIEDHASIERALTQIPMPRMRDEEIEEILLLAAKDLEMELESEAVRQIVQLSQGLPHFTHLIGLHAVREALARRSTVVTAADVAGGVSKAVETAQQSIKSQYQKATQSAHRDALFEQIILACALAPKDPVGSFQPGDVVEPMSAIMGRRYDAATFSRHLAEFCNETRGPVLVRSGLERRYRYRFSNPLLQPYVVMRGLSDRKVSADLLDAFRSGGDAARLEPPAGEAQT
jgi:Cdc6-like AAA superfamily ATPase